MQCDVCKKGLTEDDTYERIICKHCKNIEDNIHCIKCKSNLAINGACVKAINHLSKNLGYYVIPAIPLAILGIISIFNSHISRITSIAIGVVLSILTCLYLLYVIPMKSCLLVINTFDDSNFKPEDKIDRLLLWIIGLLAYGLLGSLGCGLYHSGLLMLDVWHRHFAH